MHSGELKGHCSPKWGSENLFHGASWSPADADQRDVEAKLAAFNKQIEVLKNRSAQVEKIIRKRTNPKLALERIGRDIPKDMWFSLIEINNTDISIVGSTYTFKSISDFINKANKTIFFNRSMEVIDSSSGQLQSFGKQISVENFKLKGSINYSSGNSTL